MRKKRSVDPFIRSKSPVEKKERAKQKTHKIEKKGSRIETPDELLGKENHV